MKYPHQSRYTVRRGDTLENIARLQYGTKGVWREIARANHIKRDRILVGMRLRLPTLGHEPVAIDAMNRQMQHPHLQSRVPVAPHAAYPALRPLPFSGRGQAVPVMFPAVKVLKSIPIEPVVETPEYQIEGEIECECVLQRKGTMTELEISEKGISYSGKLKADYDSALAKLTNESKIKWDPLRPENGIALSMKLTVVNKFGGQPFTATSYQVILPNRFVYTMSPREVESETPDGQYLLKGKIGFKITVTFNKKRKDDQPETAPHAISAPSPSSSSRKDQDWIPIAFGVAVLVLTVVTIFAPPAGALGWAEAAQFLGLGAGVSVLAQ